METSGPFRAQACAWRVHGVCRDARDYAVELCDAGVLRFPTSDTVDAAVFHSRLPLHTFTVHYKPTMPEYRFLEEQCAAAYAHAVRAEGLSAAQCTICVHAMEGDLMELPGAVVELLLGGLPQLRTLVVACNKRLDNLSEVLEAIGRAPCAAQLRALHFEQPRWPMGVPISLSLNERALAALTCLPQLRTLVTPWNVYEDQLEPLAAALTHLQLLGVHIMEGHLLPPLPAEVVAGLAGAAPSQAHALWPSVRSLCGPMPAALVPGMHEHGHGAGACALRGWDVQRPQASISVSLLVRLPQLHHLHNVMVYVVPEDVTLGGPHVLAAVRAASERFAHCADSWCLSFSVLSSGQPPQALLELPPGSLALVRHMRLMMYHQLLGPHEFEEPSFDPDWLASMLAAVTTAAPNLTSLAFVYKAAHATRSSFLQALLPALQALPALETLVLHMRVDYVPTVMCSGWREECSAALTGLAAGLHMRGAQGGGAGGAALRRILLYCGDYQEYYEDRRNASSYDAYAVVRACKRTLRALGVPVVVELCEWHV